VLVKALDGLDALEWAFCQGRKHVSRNLVSNFVARTKSATVGPNSQRMRATWIVAQLEVSTNPAALLDQAGVATLSALDRYLPFATAA